MSSINQTLVNFKKIDENLASFVYHCLKELRGSVRYSMDDFITYLNENNYFRKGPYQILIGIKEDIKIGFMTCNRFAMPRYLGFGIEIEEIVIHPTSQGQGLGKEMIESFLSMCFRDKSLRIAIIKTDDSVNAGKLYSKYFDISNMVVYSKRLNKI